LIFFFKETSTAYSWEPQVSRHSYMQSILLVLQDNLVSKFKSVCRGCSVEGETAYWFNAFIWNEYLTSKLSSLDVVFCRIMTELGIKYKVPRCLNFYSSFVHPWTYLKSVAACHSEPLFLSLFCADRGQS
jgi:hypothetical protein